MKFHVIVWTREPVRKFRMKEPVDDSTLGEIQSLIGSPAFKLYGTLKSGNYVVFPGDNIAYIEAVPVDDKVVV